jgi:exosortase
MIATMAEEGARPLEMSDWQTEVSVLESVESAGVEVAREPLPVETGAAELERGQVGQTGSAWLRLGLPVVVIVAILIALYWEVLRVQAQDVWDDPNYSHAFLVPLFSGFLIWRRRARLGALTAEGSWIGLPVLFAGVGALLLGDLAGETFLMRSSLIIVLAGLVLFHLGRSTFQELVFPLLFLLFMVPLPVIVFNALAFPLQNLAAQNAAWTLDLLGVPVLLDGNVIHLSRITLGVSEACSGIRSLVSLLVVAVAWGYLSLPGIGGTVALTASAVPITVLANAGRVVATGLIAQWFGVEYAEGLFHVFSGWIIFLVAFVCLLAVHSMIRRVQRRRHTQGP